MKSEFNKSLNYIKMKKILNYFYNFFNNIKILHLLK